MSLYYRIWVDCILRLKSLPKNKEDWQLKSMSIMSTAMAMNLVLIMIILQKGVLDYYFYEINIPFLSDFVNYMLTMLILYFSPGVLLNYILIFRRKRFEKLLKKYPYHNGKLFLVYLLISMLLPIIILLFGVLWTRYFWKQKDDDNKYDWDFQINILNIPNTQ